MNCLPTGGAFWGDSVLVGVIARFVSRMTLRVAQLAER